MSKQENYLYGLHSVKRLLEKRAQDIQVLFVLKGRQDKAMENLLNEAKKQGISIQATHRKQLDEFAPNGNHQGIIAQCNMPQALGEENLIDILEALEVPPFLLILDGVQDPHNLGACLRTADGAGIHAVIAPKDRACNLTPVVCKVACGAEQTVPFVQVTNLSRCMEKLKERGIWIMGTSGDADTMIYDFDLKGPLALVMGAEGQGIRQLTAKNCDKLLKIPLAGSVESLNVSVATGICLFEAVRQRQ